jgi:hypothetical protein
MSPLRCLLGHHSWRYANMPNQDVVSRTCTRCHAAPPSSTAGALCRQQLETRNAETDSTLPRG